MTIDRICKMNKELHLRKSDFRLEWFSGTGKGGQHRNKHQNCCRIIHIATGLKAQGTQARDRPTNQRVAFHRLSKLLLAHYYADEPAVRHKTSMVIRNYHGVRNEVHDKASGLKGQYKDIVIDGEIGEMIKARHIAMSSEL
jgi:protein subunit release factor B